MLEPFFLKIIKYYSQVSLDECLYDKISSETKTVITILIIYYKNGKLKMILKKWYKKLCVLLFWWYNKLYKYLLQWCFISRKII